MEPTQEQAAADAAATPEHEHGPECVACAGGHDALAERLTQQIAEHGHAVIPVFDAKPSFAYTVGLFPRLGAELLVFGLPPALAGAILNDAAAALGDGAPPVGEPILGLVPRYALTLERASAARAAEYVTATRLIYGDADVPVLQVALPDREGRTHLDADFDAEFMDDKQPLLFDRSAAVLSALDLSALPAADREVLAALEDTERMGLRALDADGQLRVAKLAAQRLAAIRARGQTGGGDDGDDCPLPEIGTYPEGMREACVEAFASGLGEGLERDPDVISVVGAPWQLNVAGEHEHVHVIHTVKSKLQVASLTVPGATDRAELIVAAGFPDHRVLVGALTGAATDLAKLGGALPLDAPIPLAFIDGDPVYLREVDPARLGGAAVILAVRAELAGEQPPRLLQLVLSDDENRFPWDDGYSGFVQPAFHPAGAPGAVVPAGVQVH